MIHNKLKKFAARLYKIFTTRIILLISLLFFSQAMLCAQNQDTIPETLAVPAKIHSPKKATYYSMALPGLGQAYNKKYWKIPIIYAGFGVLTYYISSNTKEYKKFRDAYVFVSNPDNIGKEPVNSLVDRYDGDTELLSNGMDYYRHNMELSYVLTAALYILNVVDAAVDAHFFSFDVSDDLSMKFEPCLQTIQTSPLLSAGTRPGLTLSLRLGK